MVKITGYPEDINRNIKSGTDFLPEGWSARCRNCGCVLMTEGNEKIDNVEVRYNTLPLTSILDRVLRVKCPTCGNWVKVEPPLEIEPC